MENIVRLNTEDISRLLGKSWDELQTVSWNEDDQVLELEYSMDATKKAVSKDAGKGKAKEFHTADSTSTGHERELPRDAEEPENNEPEIPDHEEGMFVESNAEPKEMPHSFRGSKPSKSDKRVLVKLWKKHNGKISKIADELGIGYQCAYARITNLKKEGLIK